MGGGRRGACRVQRAGRDPQRYVSHRDLAVVPETAGRHREARSAGGFVGRPAPQRPLPPPQAMNTLHELQFAHAIWSVSACIGHARSVDQSCPTLCNPMDYSLPGFFVHEILQARILECVAIPFSRGSSRPRDQTCISYVFCIGRQVLYH